MKKTLLLSSISLFLLAACGDEITEVTQSTDSGMAVVAAGEKLPGCSKDNVGEMAFVTDSSAVFYCADGKWKSLNGKDGSNGKDGENGKDGNDGENGNPGASCSVEKVASGYKVVCGGDSVGVILNGSDGMNTSSVDTVLVSKKDTVVVTKLDTLTVLDTVVGLNGASCTTQKIDEGYKILCGGDSVGVVLNGKNGSDACQFDDDDDGTVTITCGSGDAAQVTKVFKAVCKSTPYDPANKECVNLGLLRTCSETIEGVVAKNTNGTMYTCRDGYWNPATSEEIVVGKACLTDYLGEIADGSDGEKWTCRASAWDKSTELELAIGKSCTSLNQEEGVMHGYSNWLCRADSIGWVYDFNKLNYGSVVYGGKAYATVGVGDQMWFAENLNYADETAMPNIKGHHWCYQNTASNCAVYGRLYQWYGAMNIPSAYGTKDASNDSVVVAPHRGICPEGWHIPSADEWDALVKFVAKYNGGEGVGTSLKATGTEKGTDKFGLKFLAGGFLHSSQWSGINVNINNWGINEKDGNLGFDINMGTNSAGYSFPYYSKSDYAFAVRCIMD